MNEQQLSDPERKPEVGGDEPGQEAPRLQLVSNPSQTPRPVAPPADAQPPAPGVTNPDKAIETEENYDDYTTKSGGYSEPRKRPVRKMLIILLLLVIAGAAVYWFVLRKDPVATGSQAKQPATTNQQAEPAQQRLIAEETKHHVATSFSLEFDYPEDWTVTETAGTGKLFVRSPKLQLKDAAGKTQPAQVVLTIRDKQQAMAEFDAGNALAVLDSEKITYKQPSAVQRGSTYISFLQYASNDTVSGMHGVYITGDTGYQTDQAIPKADFVPVDPIISLTFEVCEGGVCKRGEQKTLGIAADTWKDKRLSGPLSDILKSLMVI